jgi:hypothetical protein
LKVRIEKPAIDEALHRTSRLVERPPDLTHHLAPCLCQSRASSSAEPRPCSK